MGDLRTEWGVFHGRKYWFIIRRRCDDAGLDAAGRPAVWAATSSVDTYDAAVEVLAKLTGTHVEPPPDPRAGMRHYYPPLEVDRIKAGGDGTATCGWERPAGLRRPADDAPVCETCQEMRT